MCPECTQFEIALVLWREVVEEKDSDYEVATVDKSNQLRYHQLLKTQNIILANNFSFEINHFSVFRKPKMKQNY